MSEYTRCGSTLNSLPFACPKLRRPTTLAPTSPTRGVRSDRRAEAVSWPLNARASIKQPVSHRNTRAVASSHRPLLRIPAAFAAAAVAAVAAAAAVTDAAAEDCRSRGRPLPLRTNGAGLG